MRIKALVLALLTLIWLLPALGCVEEYPYYTPQAPTAFGSSGARAFSSGEASKTALNEASQDFEDVVTSGTEETVGGEDVQPDIPKDIPFNLK